MSCVTLSHQLSVTLRAFKGISIMEQILTNFWRESPELTKFASEKPGHPVKNTPLKSYSALQGSLSTSTSTNGPLLSVRRDLYTSESVRLL